jgi:hypothetical protein
MDEQIIATYCLCDDLLHAMHHQADAQYQMSDAEVMTTAFIAALRFRGNHARARTMLTHYGYIPTMVSKSRFSRRVHRLPGTFAILCKLLGQVWKMLNTDALYVIDSLPLAVCDNIRIKRFKLYPDAKFRGFIPSKKRYFYGLKVHLMVTKDGQPIECLLTYGGFGDVEALPYYTFAVPAGAIIYADKAYNDYEIAELLNETEHIQLLPMRKINSKRAVPPYVSFVQHSHRKRLETAGSLMEQMLPKSIHAVTPQGFELQVALFVVAYSLNCYINL